MTRIFSMTRDLRDQAASRRQRLFRIDAAVVERTAADHAANAVRLVRLERGEIGVGGDAARCDDRCVERPR